MVIMDLRRQFSSMKCEICVRKYVYVIVGHGAGDYVCMSVNMYVFILSTHDASGCTPAWQFGSLSSAECVQTMICCIFPKMHGLTKHITQSCKRPQPHVHAYKYKYIHAYTSIQGQSQDECGQKAFQHQIDTTDGQGQDWRAGFVLQISNWYGIHGRCGQPHAPPQSYPSAVLGRTEWQKRDGGAVPAWSVHARPLGGHRKRLSRRATPHVEGQEASRCLDRPSPGAHSTLVQHSDFGAFLFVHSNIVAAQGLTQH
jgi:hypothetical protein